MRLKADLTTIDRGKPAVGNAADMELLADAELDAQRGSALIRLYVAVALFILLLALAHVVGRTDNWVNAISIANLLLACASVWVTRAGLKRKWIPWLSAVVDAGFVLYIGFFGPWFDLLPSGFRSALVSPWAVFLVFAFASVGGNAGAILLQTGLLSTGLALLVWWPGNSRSLPINLSDAIEPLFSDGSNVVRVALVALAGFVVATGALRSRQTLKAAIRAARERSTLEQFFPAEINQHIVSSDMEALKAGSRHRVCVLFTDIRNFTSLSETLEPERVAKLLNSFRARSERIVTGHGGVIDKFIGDGLLAVFGLTGPGETDATRALQAAEELTLEIERWSKKRLSAGRSSIEIGIGVHSGRAFVGVLGVGRMEYTVIGDAVNVAQRLEELTRTFDMKIIASSAIMSEAGGLGGSAADWEKLPNLKLRGRTEVIEAYGRSSVF